MTFTDLDLNLDLDMTKTVPGSSLVCVPSFIWIGPAVWLTKEHTPAQTRLFANYRPLYKM